MVETAQAVPSKASPLKRDWTKGPILRNLLQLSWPMVLMETLFVVSQVVDMIWIGRLGSAAIAGVGIANIVLTLVMSMDLGLIVGVRAMVARFSGAGDIKGANRVAGQAIVLGAAWGAAMTGVGFAVSRPLMGLFGVENEVVRQGLLYMQVMFAGWAAMDVLVMSLYVIQSSGDTITPMITEGSIRAVHITLCPFLVLGLWSFPHLGVAGAAVSNIISQILGAAILLVVLVRGRSRLKIAWGDLRPDPPIIWRIIRIGIPALFMNVQRSLGNLLITFFIAPFGTLAIAAHSLATRIELFITMPTFGLGMGAGVLVGQNLGAHQPQRAEKSAWLATAIVEAFLVCCSIAILVWANSIMSIFTSDPALISLGALFMRIAAAGYTVLAVSSVLQSCIAGAGDTLPNMIISIAVIWLIQIPLATLLPRFGGLGVYGVRWAIVGATFVGSVVYWLYFRSGRWKSKKV